MLGLDVGGRFLRGAICDLRGDVRARLDVEIDGRDAERVLDQIADLRERLVAATGLDGALLDSAVVGVPGVVDAERRGIALATSVAGLEGDTFGADLQRRLGLPSRSRTTSTSRRSASTGRASRAAWTTSSSSRSAPGWAPGSCCAASSIAGTTAQRRGRLRARRARTGRRPVRRAVSAFAARCAPRAAMADRARAAVRRARRSSPPRARATTSPARSSTRSRAGSRCTSSRSPPSPTSRSSCSAAGSAPTATCCSTLSAARSRAGSRIRRGSRSPLSARRPC